MSDSPSKPHQPLERPPKPREIKRQLRREVERLQNQREYPQREVDPWKPLG